MWTQVTNLVGTLPGYGPVWFDPKAITNILSLKLVKEKYQVTYDSNGEDGFVVTKPDGEVLNFIQSSMGLHYFDTLTCKEKSNALTMDGNVLVVNTVVDN